jgi:hypothetical protein
VYASLATNRLVFVLLSCTNMTIKSCKVYMFTLWLIKKYIFLKEKDCSRIADPEPAFRFVRNPNSAFQNGADPF